jgi:hypothetical protein
LRHTWFASSYQRPLISESEFGLAGITKGTNSPAETTAVVAITIVSNAVYLITLFVIFFIRCSPAASCFFA